MSEVTDGWEFHATLQLRTPLAILNRHGEHFPGSLLEQPPPICSDAEGIWVPRVKSWKELGINLREAAEPTCATDIGSLEASRYLPFLVAFRTITESDVPFAEKLDQLNLLPEQSPLFRSCWNRHVDRSADFPHSFFCGQLTQLPGIGKKAANELYWVGFHSIDEVRAASDTELLAVPGIGKSTVKRIRESRPSRP